jgi:hypothetical protein
VTTGTRGATDGGPTKDSRGGVTGAPLGYIVLEFIFTSYNTPLEWKRTGLR